MTGAVALQILVYTFSLWLGLYLLARRPAKTVLRLAGAGLAVYALALAADLLSRAASGVAAIWLARAHWLLAFLPAFLWAGTLLHLAVL